MNRPAREQGRGGCAPVRRWVFSCAGRTTGSACAFGRGPLPGLRASLHAVPRLGRRGGTPRRVRTVYCKSRATASPGLSLARQKRPDRRPQKRSRVETEGWDGVDRDLFEALRVLRMEIARRRRVPPYVIFHDTTLREIARSKPKTKDELRHVYGVGDRKAEDLGDLVLAVVANS